MNSDPKLAWRGCMLTPTLLQGPGPRLGGGSFCWPRPIPTLSPHREGEGTGSLLAPGLDPSNPATDLRRGLAAQLAGAPGPQEHCPPRTDTTLSQARYPHSCLLSNQTSPGCWKASLGPNTETPRLSASQDYRGAHQWQSGDCPKTRALTVQGWGTPEEGCPLPRDPT